MIYTEVGNAERAMQLSERAVDLARELAGFDPEQYSFDLGKALDGLAVDYLLRKDFQRAVALEEEAIALLQTSGRVDSAEDVATALINQTSGLMRMGATKRAKERLAQAGAIYGKIEEAGVVRFPWMLRNLRLLEEALNGN
jgi:tetratricopeptide (TPR) repeat protein